MVNKLAGELIFIIDLSTGSWITLLSIIKCPQKIIGMIVISSAPNFTEELIWNKIAVQKQNKLKLERIAKVSGIDSHYSHIYLISYKLILLYYSRLALTVI